MKRPLAAVGMSILLALAVFCFLPAGAAKAALVPLGALALLSFAVRRPWRLRTHLRAVLCALFAAAALFAVYDGGQRALAARVCGREWDASLRVTDCTRYDESYYIKATAIALDGARVGGLTVTFYTDAPCDVGEIYAARASLGVAEQAQLGASVTVRATLRAAPEKTGESALAYAHRFGEAVRTNIRRYLGGPEAELLCAMLTGERDGLSAAVDVSLKRSGIGHILAVSGLHVSLMLGMAAGLLERLRCGRTARFTAVSLLGLLLVALYGARPSVVRAVVMNWLVHCGAALGRESDPTTSLSAAALLVLLPSPKTAGELGFALSFASCFALCAAAPALQTRLAARRGRPLGALGRAAVSALCVSALTCPILALYGLPVSLVAPVANLLLLWLVGPMLALALPVGLLGAIGWLAPVWQLGLFAAGLCGRLLLWGSKLLGSLPFAAVQLSSGAAALLAGSLVLAAVVLPRRKKLGLVLAGGFGAAALALCLLSGTALAAGDRVVQYENSAVFCVSDGRSIALLRQTPDAQQAEYLRYWCDVRFIPAPECVILLDGGIPNGLFGPGTIYDADTAATGAASIRRMDGDMAEIRLNGRTLYARFGPGWTLELLDERGEPVSTGARGGWSAATGRESYVVRVAPDGSLDTVREA